MRVIRVFPRRTRATPTDDLAVVNRGPGLFDVADEIHVSVTFTWDIPLAEKLARMWEPVASVKVGGPALSDRGGDFVPGMYLKPGYVITSRGCPNSCWFCQAWRNEGPVRELEINEGWNILDNNLLACSPDHQEQVFQMLTTQKHRAMFTGGWEAARVGAWHLDWLQALNPEEVYFAYDEPKDLQPLKEVAWMLRKRKIIRPSSHAMSCYVLIGYPGDTINAAFLRLHDVIDLGFFPQAMLYNRRPDPEWRRFQREWANKVIVGTKMKV